MPPPKRPRKELPEKSSLDQITPVPVLAEAQTIATAKDAADREARSLERKKTQFEFFERTEHLQRGKIYAGKTFNLVAGWIYAVLTLLILQGFGFHFHLSDTVLSIAIGSTTVNVIAMLLIVLKGIFPASKK